MYKPSDTSRRILDAAFDHIQSVPYKVSLRWVFYRLLQDGFYHDKSDYKKWKALASVARKRFYLGWAPDTLADDTRDILSYAGGYSNEETLRDRYFYDMLENYPPELDHFIDQNEYIFICFEARAMADQFRYYTERINLVPFGGDPSIHLKWRIAKRIELWSGYYGSDVRILYFGDYDPKGKQIVDSAIKDIKDWCNTNFIVTHCGLTLSQALKYEVPENPEKPGEFQWEALADEGAAEIIRSSISKYIDEALIEVVKVRELDIEEEFRRKLSSIE